MHGRGRTSVDILKWGAGDIPVALRRRGCPGKTHRRRATRLDQRYQVSEMTPFSTATTWCVTKCAIHSACASGSASA